MTKENLVEQLSQCFMFMNVPHNALAQFIENSRLVNYQNDQTVYDVGATPESVYFVLQGAIKIEVPMPSGESLFVGILPRLTLFGEHEALCHTDSVARIAATGDSELLVIPRGNFMRLFESQAAFSQALSKQLAMSMRMMCLAAAHHFNSSAEKKLASLLLHLADRVGKLNGEVIRLGIKISQDELAHMMSSTRQTVNKYLNVWVDKQWIAKKQNTIEILDVKALEKLSSEALLKEMGMLTTNV